jgi:hypothetical protein
MTKWHNMNKLCFSVLFCILTIGSVCAQKIAVKTNVVYDATGTVNIGGEYAINKMLSASLSLNYNGWAFKASRSDHDMAWKHILVQPEVRYWLRESFNEHFVGVHALYTTFDVERIAFPLFGFSRKNLYKDGSAYGGGLSYGYHFYLTPRINLEFSLGVGYLMFKYKKYEWAKYDQWKAGTLEADPGLPLTRSYFGPTQVGISVVYLIN